MGDRYFLDELGGPEPTDALIIVQSQLYGRSFRTQMHGERHRCLAGCFRRGVGSYALITDYHLPARLVAQNEDDGLLHDVPLSCVLAGGKESQQIG
jgi:hypothetical protein